MKKCPYCAEEIQDEAIVCRFCGHSLENPPHAEKQRFSLDNIKILLVASTIGLLALQFLPVWPHYSYIAAHLVSLGRHKSASLVDLLRNLFAISDFLLLPTILVAILLTIISIIGTFRRFSVPGWTWMVLSVFVLFLPLLYVILDSDYLFESLGVGGSIAIGLVYLLGGLRILFAKRGV